MSGNSVLFICERFFEPIITMVSGDWKEVGGRAIRVPTRNITFQKKAYKGRWRGEFMTSDPEEIEFLRNMHWSKPGAGGVGIIREADSSEREVQLDERVAPELVKNGGDSGPRETLGSAAPSDKSREPLAPSVAKGLRGRPRKASTPA